MADATAGKFATVLFYRLDRMARTLELVLDPERRLTALNVGFQSASESYDTVTPTGRLVFHLLASMAEWEKNLILERTSIGRERIAREGKWTGGRLPLG